MDPEEKRDQVGPLPGETIRADGSVDIIIHDTTAAAKAPAASRLSEQGSLLARQVQTPQANLYWQIKPSCWPADLLCRTFGLGSVCASLPIYMCYLFCRSTEIVSTNISCMLRLYIVNFIGCQSVTTGYSWGLFDSPEMPILLKTLVMHHPEDQDLPCTASSGLSWRERHSFLPWLLHGRSNLLR